MSGPYQSSQVTDCAIFPLNLSIERLGLGHEKDKAPFNLRSRLYSHKESVTVRAVDVQSLPEQDSPYIDFPIPKEFSSEPFAGATKSLRDVAIGATFGPSWSTHWFQVDVSVPKSWTHREVHLVFDATGEALVWRRRPGQHTFTPFQGLLGCAGDDRRESVVLFGNSVGGEKETLWIELACTNMFGVGQGNQWGPIGPTPPDLKRTFELKVAHIGTFERKAWRCVLDLKLIAGIAANLDENALRARQAVTVGNKMIDVIDLDDPKTWDSALALADQFFQCPNGGSQQLAVAVGNCHIDTAWLWPVRETVRKCARSFSTQLRLMERYHEYVFAASQAQQFEWVRQYYPELWTEILEQVRLGRFVPVGGTWVEMDCNIPSGESLVRQFLLGQRFFMTHFGRYTDTFWLPDTFGYAAQLPQICSRAGIKYFLTQKLSWNQFNKMPHNTFLWEGLDGSRVLTHFPPADTYVSNIEPKELIHSIKHFRDKEVANESMFLYGWGDGGGGPNDEMLVKRQRLHDCDGLIKLQCGTPGDFFKLAEASREQNGLAVWVDELYFEKHRGTYTTAARNKKGNADCEAILRAVELVYVLRMCKKPARNASGDSKYPLAAITDLWQKTCLNQFHDIIPGSSIPEVYVDSDKLYASILHSAHELIQKPFAPAGETLLLNSLEWERFEVFQKDIASKPVIVRVPALGWAPLSACVVPAAQIPSVSWKQQEDGSVVLENGHLRAHFGACGRLLSLLHLVSKREALRAPGNVFALYNDIPLYWDAWDVDLYHLRTRHEVPKARAIRVHGDATAAIVEIEIDIPSGPGGNKHEHSAQDAKKAAAGGHTTIKQVISLGAFSKFLKFSCSIDWTESHKMLKVEFPVDVRSSTATYGIQYGHIKRPTHFNTSYDIARFEVCAQRWADLGEHGFGVSLLSDSKYGFAVHGNVMRLSLLRSPKNPDPEMDMGHHQFVYALYPHDGGFEEAGTIREAQNISHPLIPIAGSTDLGSTSLFTVSNPAVSVGAVKFCEDHGDLPRRVIVRLVESFGGQARTMLHSSIFPAQTVVRELDLLENEVPGAPAYSWTNDQVEVRLGAFEIKTLAFDL